MSPRKDFVNKQKHFSSAPVLIVINCELMERADEISQRSFYFEFCNGALIFFSPLTGVLLLEVATRGRSCSSAAAPHLWVSMFILKRENQVALISSLMFSNIINIVYAREAS